MKGRITGRCISRLDLPSQRVLLRNTELTSVWCCLNVWEVQKQTVCLLLHPHAEDRPMHGLGHTGWQMGLTCKYRGHFPRRYIYIWKLILLFTSDRLNWSKVTVKASIMLKDFYFKYMLSFWTLYLPRNPKKMYVRNMYFNNQHIRIISEGSCDWRLEWICWKFSFSNTLIVHNVLKCNNISQSYGLDYMFLSHTVNTALVSIRHQFQKYIYKKNCHSYI